MPMRSVDVRGAFSPMIIKKGKGLHERRYRAAGGYCATAPSVVEGHAPPRARSDSAGGLSHAGPHARPGRAVAWPELLGDGGIPEAEASLPALRRIGPGSG